MFLADCLCWFAFALIVIAVDPTKATTISFALFYLSLLLALTGLLAIVGLIFRGHLTHASTNQKVITAFRQAIWFSALVVFFLFLQGIRVLRWWNLIIFILFLALLEFFFISHRIKAADESD